MITGNGLYKEDFNYERFSLIWLDSDGINRSETEKKFRTIFNYVKIFENIHQCEEYIQKLSSYDRVILVTHAQFIQDVLLCICTLQPLSSVYIYGSDIDFSKQYSKIKSSTLKIDDLIPKIQSASFKLDDVLPISIYNANLDQMLTNSFISSNLILTYLLHPKMNFLDRKPFISLCREIYKTNQTQLTHIDNFEQTYSSNQSLSWYFKDTCIRKLIDTFLCLQTIEKLLLIRFFLYDLQQELKNNQYSSSITLYRSFILSEQELQTLKDATGGLVLIKTFFLAKLNRHQALADLDSLDLLDNARRVLFEIDVDSRIKNIQPYSMIHSSEILFMCGSLFRLVDICVNNDQVWIIQMNLTSLNNENLQAKCNFNPDQISLLTIGNLLWRMDQLDEAESYYLYLIQILSSDSLMLADLYYNLGHIYSDKQDYDSSLSFYYKSLEIWKKNLKPTDPDLAENHNAIATNHWKKGAYHQALVFFQKALDIFKCAHNENHPSVAMCLNNMGTVISQEKNYSQALKYYLQALTVFENYLPSDHLNLASLHCNISSMYKSLHQIDLSLEHLHLALKIYEQKLAPDHPNILVMLKNIAFIYEQKEDYQNALIYYKKIANVYQQTMSLTDPIVVQNDEKVRYLSSLQPTQSSSPS
ncbi:unnamed protein product [Adineta ricciae]|uniref:Uncharacterized protein n=1 Tax=Adineta ricciae TaxID=249248 RepID=A0A815HCH9_ADIRI|nr:unnamed protein product [Adineta ricciae]CAF1352276.1 unnamed protein product [Adineta ricciae]